jgi:hypothetical protein
MKPPEAIAPAALAAWLLSAVPAWAHSPILACFHETDTAIVCEAGYSDGASAEGGDIRVLDGNQRLLIEGKFGADNTYTFERPDAAVFQVDFIGDTTHMVTVFDDEIF